VSGSWKVLSAVVCVGLTIGTGATAQAQGKPGKADKKDAPAKSGASEAAYTQHLTNGVRLYNSGDYEGAAAEFEAAYAASPKASPLINLALTYRQLRRYPKAVEVLEKALSQHADSMDESDKQAAKTAIDDMRALFAFVTLDLSPADASVRVDGVPIPAERTSEVIPVSPGPHEIEVTAPGHTSKTLKINVASGERRTDKIELAREVGTLRVVAVEKTTAIEVDGQIKGYGTWQGELPPGPHTVRLVGESAPATVDIVLGKVVTFDRLRDGGAGLPPIPPAPDKKKPIGPEPSANGFYGHVNGAILVPLRHPDYFNQVDIEGISSGAHVGIRAGYRVNTYAGFEGIAEYGQVEGPANGTDPQSYALTTLRFGPVLRLMSPGEGFRFVGTVGGGVAAHFISFDGLGTAICPDNDECSGSGADFFAMTEAGIEGDIDGVLLGVSVALYLSGTKGMNDTTKSGELDEPYDNGVLPSLGPRVYIGYGFW
jgi:hypothetical protein